MTRKPTDIFHTGELDAQSRYNSKTEWTERAVAAVNHMYKQAIDEETALGNKGDATLSQASSRSFLDRPRENLRGQITVSANINGHCDPTPRLHKVDTQWKLCALVHNIEKIAHYGTG